MVLTENEEKVVVGLHFALPHFLEENPPHHPTEPTTSEPFSEGSFNLPVDYDSLLGRNIHNQR